MAHGSSIPGGDPEPERVQDPFGFIISSCGYNRRSYDRIVYFVTRGGLSRRLVDRLRRYAIDTYPLPDHTIHDLPVNQPWPPGAETQRASDALAAVFQSWNPYQDITVVLVAGDGELRDCPYRPSVWIPVCSPWQGADTGKPPLSPMSLTPPWNDHQACFLKGTTDQDLSIAAEEILGRIVNGDPPAVFISYSRVDAVALAQQIAGALMTQHVQVFIDQLGIHTGEKWEPRLFDSLSAASLLVAIESATVLQRPWVTLEINTAAQRGVPMFALHPPSAPSHALISEENRLSINLLPTGILGEEELGKVVRKIRLRAAAGRVKSEDRLMDEVTLAVEAQHGTVQVVHPQTLRCTLGKKVWLLLVSARPIGFPEFFLAANYLDQEKVGTRAVLVSRGDWSSEDRRQHTAWMRRISDIDLVLITELEAWLLENWKK